MENKEKEDFIKYDEKGDVICSNGNYTDTSNGSIFIYN